MSSLAVVGSFSHFGRLNSHFRLLPVIKLGWCSIKLFFFLFLVWGAGEGWCSLQLLEMQKEMESERSVGAVQVTSGF